LKIGKDQDDSSQDANHGYQFNNIGFIDDISIFAETPERMQTLLDVVQEFTWCGMEINVKKLFCSKLTRIEREGKAFCHWRTSQDARHQ